MNRKTGYFSILMQQQAPTLNTFHNLLIKECFSTEISDEEAFLLFIVLHMYEIHISNGLLNDRPDLTKLYAETQRGASESLAYLWQDTNDERCEDTYWYWRWNRDWGEYTHAENLSDTEQQTLRKIISKLSEHPWVTGIQEEE